MCVAIILLEPVGKLTPEAMYARQASGRDREPGRNGNAQRGHLREADPFAAEHRGRPGFLVEVVDVAHDRRNLHSHPGSAGASRTGTRSPRFARTRGSVLAIPSKSRFPAPSSTGAIVSVNSSTTPRRGTAGTGRHRPSRARSARRCSPRSPGGVDPVGDELECRVALDERLVRPVRDDVDRDAEARIVAPAVDDVVHRPPDEPRAAVANVSSMYCLSTSAADRRLRRSARGRRGPVVQSFAAVAEPSTESVVRPSDEAVQRHRNPRALCPWRSPFGCIQSGCM